MTQPPQYDLLVVGSGEGGKYVAWTLGSKHGKKCALVERKYLGGSCPNIACLPSKNFIHSASMAYDVRQATSYGLGSFVTKTDTVKVDMTRPAHRKVEMIVSLKDLHEGLFNSANNEVIHGEAKFIGPKTVEVGDRVVTGDVVIVNTGTRPFIDSSVPGLVESKPLTHVEILDLEVLPSHLIILGGGYVGLEFAQAYRRFGSQVTVIEKHERVLGNEDKDVVDALVDIITGEGVRIVTSAKVQSIAGVSGESVELSVNVAAEVSKITGSHILVATGRVPNTNNIGLEEAGIKLTPSKHVQVDEQLKTSVEGVFAVGDCAGSPYFTHIGFDDFRVVYSNILGAPRPGGTKHRQVPSVLFTSHELAHVGLREQEARAQGIKYRLGKVPMGAFLRTRTKGDSRGFAKVLVEETGEKILGFTALGFSAGELLPVVQLAMKLGISYREIADLVIVHPTMGEGLIGLFNSI